MKFILDTTTPTKQTKDCMVLGVFEDGSFTSAGQEVDQISQHYLTQIIKTGDFAGKINQTLTLYHVPYLKTERVLLVGCGQQDKMTVQSYRKIIGIATKALIQLQARTAAFFLTELSVSPHLFSWHIKQTVDVVHQAIYRFDDYKTEKSPTLFLQNLILFVPDKKNLSAAKRALTQGLAIAHGVELTKNIAHQPSNVCTPAYLAKQTKLLAKKYKNMRVTILEKKELAKRGMHALLAVGQGSANSPKLICIEYQGSTKNKKPIALVGKGITFDTGGISLKTADGMIGMKYDMCGAATVLGTIKSVAELALPINLVGILAVAENMPSGTACKPEDIVTGLSGQTIEIMNTDAEGRLVLSDALTYCERYQPEIVIDIATLTAAVVIALGSHATGLFSNDEILAKNLLEASEESHDRVWRMPLWEEYQEQLASPFADMSNTGGRLAGAITAACFLWRFTKKFRWAHLDAAGTASNRDCKERAATGRPVPLLVQYFINQSTS